MFNSDKLLLSSQKARTEENVCKYQELKSSFFLHHASCPQK